MKKAIAFALALVLALGVSIPALAFSAQMSAQNLSVDGRSVACEKYNIDGSNYFKLRDLAQLLHGTGSQFDVGWDETNKVVSVATGRAYTTPNGHELETGADNSASAQPSNQTIMIDGAVRSDLTVYNIGGSNFFKLREMGDALGFDVGYDQPTNTAIVKSRPAGTVGPQPGPGPEPEPEKSVMTLETLQGVWYASGTEASDGNRFEAELIISGKSYIYAYSSPDIEYYSLFIKTIESVDSETNVVYFSEHYLETYDGSDEDEPFSSSYWAGSGMPADARQIRYSDFTGESLNNGRITLEKTEYSRLAGTVEKILKEKKQEQKTEKTYLSAEDKRQILQYAGTITARNENGSSLLQNAANRFAAAQELSGGEKDRQRALAQESFSYMQESCGAALENTKKMLEICKNKRDAGRIVFNANKMVTLYEEMIKMGSVSSSALKKCTDYYETIAGLVGEIRDILRGGAYD